MNYGEILTRAWRITWNNKVLWVFGLLAGCARGNSGGSGGNGGDSGGGQAGSGDVPPQFEQLVEQWSRPEVTGVVITIACLILLLALTFFVLSIIGEGGLISGARLADEGGSVAFRETWDAGLQHFWSLLGARLILLVPVLAFLILAGGFALIPPLGLVCLLPLVCVFAIAMLILSVVRVLADRAIVLEASGVLDAYRNSWEMFKANLGPMIILGLILFVITLVVGFVMFIPLVLVFAPLALAFVADPNNPNMALLVTGGLAFLCLFPILLLINSIITTWDSAVWTLAYRQMAGRQPSAAPPAPALPA